MNGSVTVKINPKPAAAQEFTGSRIVCPGTEITYTVPEIEGADSYSWSFPAGTQIVSGAGTRTIIVKFQDGTGTDNFSVHGVNTCGSGTAYSDQVEVRPLPAAAGAIAGSAVVCSGTLEETYNVGLVLDATSYQWTLPAGAILSGSNAAGNEITVSFPDGAQSGNITVTPANACGTGASSPLAVTVNPLPVKYSITVTNGGEYCQDGAGVDIGMSASEIGVTYSLLRNGALTGDTEPGDGNAISFGTFTQTGTYTATASNASTCAATMNGSVTVKINPKPAAAQEFTGSRLVCPDTEITYTVPEIEGAD
jgi:uncharacterized Zn-binding protein involved in type VI secretion